MKNRQKKSKNKHKNKKTLDHDKTFSVPEIVAEPKTEKERKRKILEVNREKNETDLEADYLADIQKLSPIDLGIINDTANSSGYYPKITKKDRHYNRGIQRAKDDLLLLNFLIINLKPYYRHQIFSSGEFANLIQKYLGIDYFHDEFTREEKDRVLALASQMLINSFTVIKNYMPLEFSEILKQNARPFFDLVEAITKFSQVHNIKNIPDIHIPDSLR